MADLQARLRDQRPRTHQHSPQTPEVNRPRKVAVSGPGRLWPRTLEGDQP
jgi:hypothetical protein